MEGGQPAEEQQQVADQAPPDYQEQVKSLAETKKRRKE